MEVVVIRVPVDRNDGCITTYFDLLYFQYTVFCCQPEETTVKLVPRDISASASRMRSEVADTTFFSDQVPGSHLRGNVAEHHTATITWLRKTAM